MVAYVGVTAIISDPRHIKSTDHVSALRRPYRSAAWPNRIPPNGRAIKPAAKIAAAESCCATGSVFGKKDAAKYSANAAYAYTSNHSMRFPIEPTRMAFTRRRVSARSYASARGLSVAEATVEA